MGESTLFSAIMSQPELFAGSASLTMITIVGLILAARIKANKTQIKSVEDANDKRSTALEMHCVDRGKTIAKQSTTLTAIMSAQQENAKRLDQLLELHIKR